MIGQVGRFPKAVPAILPDRHDAGILRIGVEEEFGCPVIVGGLKKLLPGADFPSPCEEIIPGLLS